MSAKWCFTLIVITLLLLALSSDLLYLYYAGSWFDKIKAIEYTEVGTLWGVTLIAPFIILRVIWELKKIKNV